MTATIANVSNRVEVSNVKLIDKDNNEIVLTSGYTIEVINPSTNEVVQTWEGGPFEPLYSYEAGTYKVVVKYGSYTSCSDNVEINGLS